MSAIAYITDSKLLEMHRLNQNKEMNFWRLNTTYKFTNFNCGDLLFFLSKDKEHMRHKEKGIVGYGRCVAFNSCSINTMWKRYGQLNGYRHKEDFVEAIMRVSKDHKKPSTISSIYLKDVVFFQTPVYLSECGMNISSRIESYIYLDSDNNTAFKILDKAKGFEDLWSSSEERDNLTIEREEIRNALYLAYEKIGLKTTHNKSKSAQDLNKFILPNYGYERIRDSKFEGYKIEDNVLTIVFAPLFMPDRISETRILFGQSEYYRYLIEKYYPYDLDIVFKTSDHNEELESLMNRKYNK